MTYKVLLLWIFIYRLLSRECITLAQKVEVTFQPQATTATTTTPPPPTPPGIPSMTLADQPYIWAPGGRHYPQTNQSVIVETIPGYVISVEVTKCDIDSDGWDYLQINSGNSLNATDGRAFTYKLKEIHKYLFHSNQVIAFFRVNDTSQNHNSKTGIEIVFTRLGEITTTTSEPTTTTIKHPTTANGDEASIQVDILGHSDKDYRNSGLVDCLKNALLNMTRVYCQAHKIIPKDNNITLANVMLEYLIRCPYNWPDSEKCVQAKFKIPIFLSEDSPVQGYQLNSYHLTSMWNSLATEYLSNCHLSTYKEPNINGAIKWWIIIATSVTLVFFILLCVIKWGCVKWSYIKRKRRSSDTVTIMSHGSIGTGSLEPHYMQKTPPLFEAMYPMYKPGEETYTEPIISTDLRSKKQDDETYSEPITSENFNPQNNRFTLISDDMDAETEDAFA